MDRFWSKVKKSKGCWEWQACKNNKGYGVFTVQGRNKLAHRIAYEMVNGKILPGFQVNHTCDNRSCVNPEHLILGTAKDNTNDMIRRGRAKGQPPGEDHRDAKLTSKEVREIRKSHIMGHEKFGQVALAKRYGVNARTINSILKGHTWKHVT